MEKFKGTKSSWHLIGNNGIHDNKGVCLAIATTDGILSDTECNSNAKLIAAAPELLEALIEIVKTLDEPGVINTIWLRDFCQSAITKAL